MSSWKYSLKQLVYLLLLMKSVHKIHFPPFRSHYKSNLVSISEIRGGPQKPLGHLVHTEEIELQKKRVFPFQKRMRKFLRDEALNFFPLLRRGHQQHMQILWKKFFRWGENLLHKRQIHAKKSWMCVPTLEHHLKWVNSLFSIIIY